MPHSTIPQQLCDLHSLPAEKGTLSFIKDHPKYKHERPYRWAGSLETSQEHKRTNILLESQDGIAFADIRSLIGQPDKLSLQRNGFQILTRTPGQQDPVLGGEPNVLQNYLSSLALDIKELLLAETVYCVNFVFRQCTRDSLTTPHETFFQPSSAIRPDVPAFPAHADFTRIYGETIIKESLTPDEATKYLTDDYQIWLVNAWKPLYRPVRNAPLALCDPSTIVRPEDVLEVDIASPTRVSGATYLKYKPSHKWYWCSNQTPDEISLFKSWDSDVKSSVPYVPHCAVRLEGEDLGEGAAATLDDNQVLRDSIEARMVVVVKREGADI